MFKKSVYIILVSCIGAGCLFGLGTTFSQGRVSEVTISSADRDQLWSKGETPEWVVEYPFEVGGSSSKGAGNETSLLQSVQDDIESETVYVHEVKQINNEMGAQNNSCFSVDFDPQYQKVVMHTFRVWREGGSIDMLENSKFEVIQREQRLQDYIYDGRMSLISFLQDIRVGDVLEVSYSIQGVNPIYPGKFFGGCHLRTAGQGKHVVYRALAREGKELRFKTHGPSYSPMIRPLGDGKTEYVWELKNVSTVRAEDDTPSWYFTSPYVEVSEFDSWKEVLDWARGLFTCPEQLSPELSRVIEELQAKGSSEEERATLALRYVQDKIRYMGIEAGLGSHQPSQPDDVFKKGYGDCKDKSFLLHVMLEKMGIESYPALVHTTLREHVSDWLPSPGAFNHAILAIRINGNTYWVDPTRSLEGGLLSSRGCLGYGQALMLSPEAQGLSVVDCGQRNEPDIETVTIYDVSDRNLSGKLTLKTIFRGNMAVAIRSGVQQVGEDEFLRMCQEGSLKDHEGVRGLGTPSYRDDREKNEIVVSQSFAHDKIWEVSTDRRAKALLLFPVSIVGHLKTSKGSSRKAPLAITYPVHVKEKIEVKGATISKSAPIRKNFQNSSMAYVAYGQAVNNKHFVMEYEFKTYKDHVSAQDISKHKEMIEKVQSELITKFIAPVR